MSSISLLRVRTCPGKYWNFIIRIPGLEYSVISSKVLENTGISSKVLDNFGVLGVRSLANASRARQFNPLNPLGWGGYRFLKQIWQPWSVVHGRAWSCVVGRAWSCVVGHAWSCVVGHAWSCVVVRAWSVVRGRARSVVRGRAVLPASRPALP